MPKSAVLLCGFLTLLLAAAVPGYAKDGKTIFGENKKETFKAMKGIAKSLGVKCLHCHVKESGKIKYEIDTPHKEIARQMKHNFVDSLGHKLQVELEIPHEGNTIAVLAKYHAQGDSAGIHLKATTPAEKTYQKEVLLPEKGAAITCMTCHNGQVHFLTEAEEEK